ncbi:MAG: hypothetical protein IJW17_02945 [Lentisphaeria bacterium]|nr:hypothetical protein [Lentisphaeria bacterium]
MKKILSAVIAATAMFFGTSLSAGTQEDLQKMIKDALTVSNEMSMDSLTVMYADDAEIIKPDSVRIAKDVFAPSIAMLDALKKGDLLAFAKAVCTIQKNELPADIEKKIKAMSAEEQKATCHDLSKKIYAKMKAESDLRLKTLKFEAFKEEGNNAVVIAISVNNNQWERTTFYFEKKDGKWKVISQESVYLPLEQKKEEAK